MYTHLNSIHRSLWAFALCLVALTTKAQTDSTKLSPESDTVDLYNNNFNLPVFSTTTNDLGDNIQSQDVTSLLMASRDVFMQTVSMHFMPARFRYRGYTSENMTVMLNGVRINSLESGIAGWSTWGGMNDVIRFMDMKTGLGASRSTFGDVGGYFNLNIYASSYRKGLRVSYSRGNRIFKDRVTATYSTGLMKNGWAISASGTARYAKEGYVPGTFFQGFGYYIGVDKVINAKHTLSFTGFGAPITQGRQSMETDEAFTLTDNHYYNSFWGYQNGVKRNAKVSTTNKPTAMLSHVWSVNPTSKLTTSAFYTFGRQSLTNLNWFDDKNPTPDYYQYLPSYYGPNSSSPNPYWYNVFTQNWQNNTNVAPYYMQDANNGTQQINWDALYNANNMNLYSVVNAEGSVVETGKRSKYIIEEQRQDVKSYGINSIYNTRVNSVFISAGVNANITQTRHYKVLNDLLGGDFWLDVDQFAEQLNPNPLTIQNNLSKPYTPIHKGDVFGYDYNINVSRYEAWGQVEKSFNHFDLYASATINTTSFFRDGAFANGKFPTTSAGKSETVSFLNYGVKAGGTYKINGRHFITVNGAFLTKPPLPNASFVSVQTRNDLIKDISPNYGSEQILSGDITYSVKLPWLRGRFTYYYSQINNQVWLRNYFDDVYKTNVNYIMTGLNQLNQGVEAGVEATIRKRVSIIGALAYGQFIYTNRPTGDISADNSAQLLATNRVIYFKNYHVGNMPQTAGSIGVRYNSKKYWFVGVYYNYFADNYVEANPDRRTAEAVSNFLETDPQYKKIISQEKLPSAYTIDMMAGKSFLIKKKYGLNLTLIVNNLTNNSFKNSGVEQLRHDVTNIDKFPNKYSYSMGLSYMLSAAFTFR